VVNSTAQRNQHHRQQQLYEMLISSTSNTRVALGGIYKQQQQQQQQQNLKLEVLQATMCIMHIICMLRAVYFHNKMLALWPICATNC
jgi:hypothetical protein